MRVCDMLRVPVRRASRWRTLLFGEGRKEGANVSEDQRSRHDHEDSTHSSRGKERTLSSLADTEAHLRGLASSMSPGVPWTHLLLPDLATKNKVLLSCERELGRTVPSHHLDSLNTLGDVWHYFTQQQPNQYRTECESVFPQLSGRSLPPNLSVQFPPEKQQTHTRVPFQNFNNPRHAQIQYRNKSRKTKFT